MTFSLGSAVAFCVVVIATISVAFVDHIEAKFVKQRSVIDVRSLLISKGDGFYFDRYPKSQPRYDDESMPMYSNTQRTNKSNSENVHNANVLPLASVPNKQPKLFRRNSPEEKNIQIGLPASTFFQFSESNGRSLYVHWVGSKSNIILLLAETADLLSSLWRSTDYGKTFLNENESVGNEIIDSMVVSPHDGSRVILLTPFNDAWITLDAGETFTKVSYHFHISSLKFHPVNPDYILCTDKKRSHMFVSVDFGRTWTQPIKLHASHYGWGSPGVTPQSGETIWFTSRYRVYQSTDLLKSYRVIQDSVVEFKTVNYFTFLFVSNDDGLTKRLLVSKDDGKTWNLGLFPNREFLIENYYSIVDASEGNVFIIVDHSVEEGSFGKLYTSDLSGTEFSLSLERVLFLPEHNAISDFTKVDSVVGVYIANKITSKNFFETVITFDKGGVWQPIKSPKFDLDGNPFDCDPPTCSLHLHSSYSMDGMKLRTITGSSDAIGIIVAHGNCGKELSLKADVFVSRDGGWTWKHCLKGPHFYAIADRGGLIVAAPKSNNPIDTVVYSYDEGESWHEYKFTEVPILVQALIVEPGSTSLVFSLWGVHRDLNQWVLVQINMSNLFLKTCVSSDYETWSHIDNKCLLGQVFSYDRRKQDAFCFNDEIPKVVKSVPCSCQSEDFECDYGFRRTNLSSRCLKDPLYNSTSPCTKEERHYRKSLGYRLVPGDKCINGVMSKYVSETILSCDSTSRKTIAVSITVTFGSIVLLCGGYFINKKIFNKGSANAYNQLSTFDAQENDDDDDELFVPDDLP